MDKFQERYEEHQSRKKQIIDTKEELGERDWKHSEKFLEILENRRSQRMFNDVKIPKRYMLLLAEAVTKAPSSCNRQAIYVVEVEPFYLDNMLVGAKNWAHNADRAWLIFADKLAYKSPNEKAFMPYLDAGFVGQNIYLMCEYLGIGTCFINPNIREENKPIFEKDFGDDYFCGAFVFGNYDKKPNKPRIRTVGDVLR